MGSHGIKDRVAIVGMGCTTLRRALGQGPRRPARSTPPARRSRRPASPRTTSTPTGSAPPSGGMSGITLAKPAPARGQAGHPRRELLRHRLRGAAPGRLRGRLGRLRRRHGRRRREGEGLRLPGPQRVPDPQRRHQPHAHRGRHVLDGRPGLRRASTACPWTSSRRCWPASPRRTTTTAPATRGPSSAGRCRSSRSAPCRRSPAGCPSSTAPAWPTVPPRRSSCRAEDAHRYTDKPLYVKALSFVAGNGSGPHRPRLRLHDVPRDRGLRAADAYAQAGITDPRAELAMAEVHDCFTPTELVLMEDLGFCERGTAWKEVLAGAFDLDGDLPVNPDGGLKSFGHPVGASGPADDVRGLAAAARRGPGGAPDRHVRPTATSPSPTTSAATPARWSASSASSAATVSRTELDEDVGSSEVLGELVADRDPPVAGMTSCPTVGAR